MECSLQPRPIDPGVRIGHVHLKVADLERALEFYCGVLGFEMKQRYGGQAAFVAAGGYHHHIALNTWESKNGPPPPHGTTGLYHLAILYPTRAELADALRRLMKAGVSLDGASDHGVILSARSGWQRRRTLLGSRRNRLAKNRDWYARDVHAASGPRRSPPGSSLKSRTVTGHEYT